MSEIKRKLASLQKIAAINSILGRDRIEVAKILGWEIIVQKGLYKVGDLCVFFEVDSLLPDIPIFDFMKEKRLRVKPMKMAGVISQGLAIPLSDLAIIEKDKNVSVVKEEGNDLTDLIGVVKYELPEEVKLWYKDQKIAGKFPFFIPKTDEPRIQSYPELLNEMVNRDVEITVKLDGTSFTAYYDKTANEFGVCSRNVKIAEGDNLYWNIVKKYNLQEQLKNYIHQSNLKDISLIAIQGEICGPKIQGNTLKLKEPNLFIYNILHDRQYINFSNTIIIFGLLTVPRMHTKYRITEITTIDDLVEIAMSSNIYSTFDLGNKREGIVVRPLIEDTVKTPGSSLLGNRLSFKVINPMYGME